MDLQPTLESDLLKIRPMRKDDLEPLYHVAKDPKIWEQHPCKRSLRWEFEKFFRESIDSKGALIILDKKTNKIIGSSRFKEIVGYSNGIEIGWTFLCRDYWGGKFNSDLKKLMIDHAFKFVENVIFFVDKNNFRSQKAVGKIGGRKPLESEKKHIPNRNTNNVTFIIRRSTI